MNEPTVTIRFTAEPEARDLPPPELATAGAAGADLRAAVTEPVVLEPGEYKMITTGLRLEIPPGYEVQVRPRSGLAARHGVTLVNSPGTIDSDYRGVVHAILINHGREPFTVNRGDRIAQIVAAPVTRPVFVRLEEGELSGTERGAGGFGHTGVS